mmetsp:Transcript_17087/g.39446  ORF Transcript_17087/g.39446 Transcript_17087/m.39446 type:complete len:1009 (+) Transcript_17087:154-3180(+)|eukprot:CAMPEP_0197187864 /NCGR_PEP_ID=MMETSP1423-20130617/16730_1 /TAXON_ID=476441 /ORGANISM="Pseudo-nitzschia heimii, Strain UNC1101" /LENGTH=1008 /DNA_ID=CAMNT_0042639549 /DNA_START=88 /DNA_END=3114 /DNA_ORIENTATION=-
MSSHNTSTKNDRRGKKLPSITTASNSMNSISDSENISSQRKNVITPQVSKRKKSKKHLAKVFAKTKTSLDIRMSVEKNVVDELLLVCGVIGTTTNSGNGNELVPVTDCLNWLQDLQRALRRDEDSYRPISLLLGKWKIVEQKLLPLVVTCRYDTPIVLTVLKIMVILTKPLAETSQRAGQMIIDTASSKSDPAVVAQQIKLRQNAVSQAEQLMEYKRLFTFHHTNFGKNESTRSKGPGILSVFVSLLAEPLSKSGASRTDADHLTIELVLHLIRNLLSAHPLLNTSSETSRQAAQLHQDMINLFNRELVLKILLVIGQEMELPENAQYNLLMMEILHHILKTQDPTAVARSFPSKQTKTSGKTPVSDIRYGESEDVDTRPPTGKSFNSSSALASKLKKERSQLNNLKLVRHGNFSGTWMRRQTEGRRQFIAATNAIGGSFTGSSRNRDSVQSRRKNRLGEPFIGSGKSLLAHTRPQLVLTASAIGPSAKRTNQTLYEFCKCFLVDCYGPFMKSIKNEFRRDSHRLEEKDKIVFFKLVWFFSQFSRISSSLRRISKKSNSENVGHLIITMDVFTFNLVLSSTDYFYQQKKYTRLAQTVALYAEMMHLLYNMYTSKDKTENEMAMGLLDRLFYHGQDALDQLPKLLSRWTPGTYTREYVCDLIEVTHISLKLLETNSKRGIKFVLDKKPTINNAHDEKVSKKIAKMRKDAAEFDVNAYFTRKLVSNHLISMYCYLLEQYKVNANVVNHRIISMFLRVMRLEIAIPDKSNNDNIIPLDIRRVTLEPMLYNLQLVMVVERILNDMSIQKDMSFQSLLEFGTSFMYKFWDAANSNPMLYVECLFQHASPHRFCDSLTNLYVNDELRMLAEREILQEDQLRDRIQLDDVEKEVLSKKPDHHDDNEDEAENEFTGEAFLNPSRSKDIYLNDENEEKAGAEDGSHETSEVRVHIRPGTEMNSSSSRKRKWENIDNIEGDVGSRPATAADQCLPNGIKCIQRPESDDDHGPKEHSLD